jgi:hypothetical protein
LSDLGSDLRKNSVVILDDGVVQGVVNRIDFTGGTVTVSGVTATVPLGGGGGGGTTITVQDEGVTQSTTVTTLNFTGGGVTASGGGATATINVPSGGGGSSVWTEMDVDFGTKPVYDAQFTITDAGISASSKVMVLPSGKASTGRTADDWQWDGAVFAANPASGSATCYATFLPGPIVGFRKLQYQVAA